MKRATFLRIFGILFVATILYRNRANASARPAPIADPMAVALGDPWPSPFAYAKTRSNLFGKTLRRTSGKMLSRVTEATSTAVAQAAGAHVAEKILGTNQKK